MIRVASRSRRRIAAAAACACRGSQRDLRDLGAANIEVIPLHTLGYGAIAQRKGVLFVTYTGLIGKGKGGSRIDQITRWLDGGGADDAAADPKAKPPPPPKDEKKPKAAAKAAAGKKGTKRGAAAVAAAAPSAGGGAGDGYGTDEEGDDGEGGTVLPDAAVSDWGGCLLFDESHRAKNLVPEQHEGQDSKGTLTGRAVSAIQVRSVGTPEAARARVRTHSRGRRGSNQIAQREGRGSCVRRWDRGRSMMCVRIAAEPPLRARADPRRAARRRLARRHTWGRAPPPARAAERARRVLLGDGRERAAQLRVHGAARAVGYVQ